MVLSHFCQKSGCLPLGSISRENFRYLNPGICYYWFYTLLTLNNKLAFNHEFVCFQNLIWDNKESCWLRICVNHNILLHNHMLYTTLYNDNGSTSIQMTDVNVFFKFICETTEKHSKTICPCFLFKIYEKCEFLT